MTVAPASTSTSLIAAVSSSNSSVGRSAKSGNRAIQLASTTGIVPQEEAPERQVVTPCCSYPESPDNRCRASPGDIPARWPTHASCGEHNSSADQRQLIVGGEASGRARGDGRGWRPGASRG